MSYMRKNEVKKVLEKFAVNTQLLRDDYLKYNKNKTGDIALSIAEKYFDYTIYMQKNAKKNFIKAGKTYLKKSRSLFKKEGDKNKESQKMQLLGDVYTKILLGDYKKAIKTLDKKFKANEIEEKNKAFYDFLNFTAYSKLKDRENAKSWYEKLKTHPNSKLLVLKSRKI